METNRRGTAGAPACWRSSPRSWDWRSAPCTGRTTAVRSRRPDTRSEPDAQLFLCPFKYPNRTCPNSRSSIVLMPLPHDTHEFPCSLTRGRAESRGVKANSMNLDDTSSAGLNSTSGTLTQLKYSPNPPPAKRRPQEFAAGPCDRRKTRFFR